jgi:hypothetical protein
MGAVRSLDGRFVGVLEGCEENRPRDYKVCLLRVAPNGNVDSHCGVATLLE